MGRTKLKSWAMMTAAWMALGVPAAAYLSPQAAAAKSASTKADAPPPVAQVRYFRIAPQDLVAALNEFGRQSGRDILFSTDVAKQKRSTAVDGPMTAEQALRTLLSNTGLTFRATSEHTFLVETEAEIAPQGPSPQPERRSEANEQSDGKIDDASGPVEKVTVTGSRIRGAKQASPVVTITRDDMKAQGATDLGQVARSLPQSFAGGQNPAVSLGSGGQNQNITGSSSINLRGLGQDATLTLLNGTRLPYDGFTQATDVASIPIAAIDRMEVLLDGASAIYGSDAVGGVANIILKRDYDGVEIAARWGAATEGGYEQQQYTAVGGTVWTTGGFIATADFNRNSGVKARDRDYVTLPDGTSLYPPSEQRGALFSGHQQFGDFVELTLDAFYTEREGVEYLNLAPTLFGADGIVSRDTTIWGIMPSLRFALPGDWTLRLHGAVGQNESIRDQSTIIPSGPTFRAVVCYCNDAESAGVEAEGPLFDLPGGEARLAVGGGYRGNEFKSVNFTSGTIRGGDDSSQFVYGELFLPLIGAEQNIPFVHRLSLSGAVRHEDYESFGETTTPKVGAIWGVTADLDLKATWGKSFKVPTLIQQHSPIFLDLFDANFVGSGYPVGSGVLFFQGGNPDLTPERAETVSAGFIARPGFLPGFSLEVSWFDIDYTDRVVQPVSTLFQAFSNPTLAEFIIFNPTVAQQNAAFALAGQAIGTFPQGVPPPPLGPYDPARVVAIFDARYVNAASQKVNGVDLLARYTFDLFSGSFTANAGATWLDIEERLTSLAPERPGSGVVFRPTEFRGRIGGTWSGDGWLIAATVNHTGGVTNNLVPPFEEGDGWTTVDLVVDYTFETGPFGGGLELTLGVQNLFNEEPPLLSPLFNAFANYDSTNYNSLGRIVNVTVSQRF